MSAKITSREGALKGKDLSFHQEITIGRDPKNKIFLNKEEISKTHVRFFYDETKKCYFIEDLQSRNGTALDDTRIQSKERLGHLHVITLAGKYDFIFQDLSLCALRNPRHEEATPIPPVSETVVAKKGFVLPSGLGDKKEAKQAPALPVSGTVIADKAFVLPTGLGNKKKEEPGPVLPVSGTIIADKAFVLPAGLGKKEGEESTPAPPESGTVIADKAFVLPTGLGNKKEEEPAPALPVSGTIIADKAFVLPPDLGKKEEEQQQTPAPPGSGTVIADKAFVLPTGLGNKKEEKSAPALSVSGTIIADKAFVLPEGLGEKEKAMTPELSESDARTKLDPEPVPISEDFTQKVQSNLLDEEKTQIITPKKNLYFMEVLQEGASQHFPLIEGENVIGRKSICDIVINSNQVSRRHAVLTLKNGRFFIRDEQSKNKTFFEGKPIQKTVEIGIKAKIRFGKIEVKLILKEQ